MVPFTFAVITAVPGFFAVATFPPPLAGRVYRMPSEEFSVVFSFRLTTSSLELAQVTAGVSVAFTGVNWGERVMVSPESILKPVPAAVKVLAEAL